MAQNYRELPGKFSEEEQRRYADGIGKMTELASFLKGKGLLPERFLPAMFERLEGASSIQDETPYVARLEFTDQEKEVLTRDEATVYHLTGETIRDQVRAGRPVDESVAGTFSVSKGRREELLGYPARRMDVAIYPEPGRFFVPGSFDMNTDQQDLLMKQDVESLRRRLRLVGINMIRPKAAEAFWVILEHFERTGIRLLGEDYADQADGHIPFIRTSTLASDSGSQLINVGGFNVNDRASVFRDGLDIFNVGRLGRRIHLAVARWIVPL